MSFDARYALVPLCVGASVFGFYTTLATTAKNGGGAVISAVADGRVALLRGAPEPFKRVYTGYPAIDGQLSIVVGFFSFLVDGPVPPDAFLFYVWGMAQFCAAWTLLMLEGFRAGNRGRIVSFASIVGALFQNLTFTVTVPLYVALHLFTSPVSRLRGVSGDSARSTLTVDYWNLAQLPVTVVVSFVVPAVFMSMPHLFDQSAATHWNWLAAWQPFPVVNILLIKVLHGMCSAAFGSPTPRDEAGRPTTPGQAYMASVRSVYRFGLGLCALTQVPIVLAALLPAAGAGRETLASAVPGLGPLLAAASLRGIFVPAWVTDAPSVIPTAYGPGDMAPLGQFFLQYDLYTGIVTMLLWSLYLHQQGAVVARSSTGGSGGGGGLGRSLPSTALWLLIGGPAAAVLFLHWDRDEAVMAGEEEEGVPLIEVKKTK
ncbi:hypothetical protein GGR56DRAFT_628949 [Xylariaceae sp. FL0804]|nr:hypothetical protein GGR56DRAFT_628949 [Xylariaceae sp. FL0804]